MTNWFATNNNLERNTERLRADIMYHRRALECCTEKFLYYRDIKTSCAESYAQLAHEYYRAGKLDTALSFYKKAVEHNHHHFQARNQIGLIYFKQQKYALAIEAFEELIYLAKESYDLKHKIDALLSLGLIYSKFDIKGNVRKAYKCIMDAKMLCPNYELTENIIQQINQVEKTQNNDIFKQSIPRFLKNPNEIHSDIEYEAMESFSYKLTSLNIY